MRRIALSVAVATVLLMNGCGGGDDDETATTGQPGQTTTEAPTTTTAEPKTLDAEAVVTRLRDDGLPIGEVKVYTAANDPNEQLGRPGGYTSKVNFRDTRLEQSEDTDVDGGGSLEVFENENDAKSRYEYVDAITRGNGLFNEYHWLEGTIFLRVSKSLTPDQAEEYNKALQAMA